MKGFCEEIFFLSIYLLCNVKSKGIKMNHLGTDSESTTLLSVLSVSFI